MRVKVLEAGSLTEAKQLVVEKAVLDSFKLLHICDDQPACLATKCWMKASVASVDTDANETFGAEGCERDVPVERSECGAVVLSYFASLHTQPAG